LCLTHIYPHQLEIEPNVAIVDGVVTSTISSNAPSFRDELLRRNLSSTDISNKNNQHCEDNKSTGPAHFNINMF
jgi:hypothetical protein